MFYADFFLKLKNKWAILVYDFSCIVIAWYLAYFLRFNIAQLSHDFFTVDIFKAVTLVFITQSLLYLYCRVYRGKWRYASFEDMLRIVKATLYFNVYIVPLLYFSGYLYHVPRAIIPLYSMNYISLLVFGRLLIRRYYERRVFIHESSQKARVLLIGAGSAGELLMRYIIRHQEYTPIGFLDDDKRKKGVEIHGVPVIDTIAQLPKVVKQYQVDNIFIAIPSADATLMRHIVNVCDATGVTVRTLPGVSQLVNGTFIYQDLRDIRLEDLLGRAPLQLDNASIYESIYQQVILVTGAGGSIGSELCRQLLKYAPQKIILVDNCEFNLYQLIEELQSYSSSITIKGYLTSITDKEGMKRMFKSESPDICFHVAAFKHVPLLQHQVREAVLNNVMGTQCLATLSIEYQLKKFIFISTDKAVNPTNTMGATKRLGELICQYYHTLQKTAFMIVRFGNVLGSTGSVVPRFQKQLQEGGPLTVTHRDIERFFMTIPEATQLILQALSMGKGGEIFILNMGEPIKIIFLAEQMIRLSGKLPYKEIDIVFTGLRPGEKLYEELFYASEQLHKTAHEKLFCVLSSNKMRYHIPTCIDEMNQSILLNDETMLLSLLNKYTKVNSTFSYNKELTCSTV